MLSAACVPPFRPAPAFWKRNNKRFQATGLGSPTRWQARGGYGHLMQCVTFPRFDIFPIPWRRALGFGVPHRSTPRSHIVRSATPRFARFPKPGRVTCLTCRMPVIIVACKLFGRCHNDTSSSRSHKLLVFSVFSVAVWSRKLSVVLFEQGMVLLLLC